MFFLLLFCGLQSESDSRANTAEPRSKQKTMGEGAKGENNYQESANKKKKTLLFIQNISPILIG